VLQALCGCRVADAEDRVRFPAIIRSALGYAKILLSPDVNGVESSTQTFADSCTTLTVRTALKAACEHTNVIFKKQDIRIVRFCTSKLLNIIY
jgi:hypothetical protein